MGLDAIPSRTNGQTIDETWYNILKSVLSGELAPRDSGGLVTPGQDLGDVTNYWANLFAQHLKLIANGNVLTIEGPSDLASNQTITLGKTNKSITSSCGTFSTTSTSYVDVTNLSESFTSHGGLLHLALIPDGSAEAYVNMAGNRTAVIAFLRDGVIIAEQDAASLGTASGKIPVSAFRFWDDPGPGIFTYSVQIKTPSSSSVSLVNAQLIVVEMK